MVQQVREAAAAGSSSETSPALPGFRTAPSPTIRPRRPVLPPARGAAGFPSRRWPPAARRRSISKAQSSAATFRNGGNGRHDIAALSTGVTINSSHDAIGNTNGYTLASSTADLSTANSAIGLLKLTPLALNSPGTTKTHLLQTGSTAIGAGSNPAPVLTVDQNGNPRLAGTNYDIGSTEHIIGPPSAVVGALANVTVDNGSTNPYQFTITYTAESKMNRSTIGDALEVQVTPTGGSPIDAVFVSANSAIDAPVITATYKITPPDGTWDPTDFNNYTVSILDSSVYDTDGLPVTANASLGSFIVNVPTVFLVTNTDDSGTGSLRDAISQANANTVGTYDLVQFDTAGVFATPQTIVLTSGAISISDGLTVQGPSGGVTISGNNASSIFSISGTNTSPINGTNNLPVYLSNLKLTNATASSAGGAIAVSDELLTLTDCTISNSTSGGNGGAIDESGGNAGLLTLLRTTFLNNKGVNGGAVAIEITSPNTISLNVQDSTFSGNTATNGGAISATAFFPNVNISGTALYNNSASGNGGAINLDSGVVSISQSTISGNTASSGGGIGVGGSQIQLALRNDTITLNVQTSATGNGGGIFWNNTTGNSSMTFNSNIIAGNILTSTASTASPDVHRATTGNIAGDNNLIGVSEAGNFTMTGTNPLMATPGTKASPIDPRLMALADNGGLSLTHAIMPRSIVVDAGNNIFPAFTTDQRGSGFDRVDGSAADVGAYERVQGVPAAFPNAFTPIDDSNAAASNPYTFTVSYANEDEMNSATFGNDDVRVTGPNFDTLATYVSSTGPDANGVFVATYAIPAPGSGWTFINDGTYTVSVEAAKVAATNGNTVPATAVGTINVALAYQPTTFVVLNTNDSGFGSLRQALTDANFYSGTADTIVFEATTFSTPQTITLTSGELPISDSVTLMGPAMSLLTISSNNSSRVFDINGPGTLDVTISDMKITGGKATSASPSDLAGYGGGIFIQDENVNLTRLNITGNSATYGGGGINIGDVSGAAGAGNTITITDSIVAANSATSTDGGSEGSGGGIAVQTVGGGPNITLNIATTTIQGNSAEDDGGGIDFKNGGSLILSRSTIANNVSGLATNNGDGGGIAFSGSVGSDGFTVRNSTISGNSAATIGGVYSVNGGGLGLANVSGPILVANSTVVNNTSAAVGAVAPGAGGGGISVSGPGSTLTVISSVVSRQRLRKLHCPTSRRKPRWF